ncbi:hypothetical protein HN388_01835 [bacterium]|nr:hypothetical protein [bacterium]
MRFRATLALLAALVLFAVTAQAAEQTYSLVRYHFDSLADEEYLMAHPEYDVVSIKHGVSADIVVTPKYLEKLQRIGAEMEIVIPDMTTHYQQRNQTRDYGAYHTWPQVVTWMDQLRTSYPGLVSEKWSIGQTIEGRDIWAFRISNNPDIDQVGVPEILFDGTHHAREIMSSEFIMMFADYLTQNYSTDNEIASLLNSREVYFVPVVNPDGAEYNRQISPNGGGMWRKNRRDNGDGSYGVDPNRNYPYMWGGGGSSGDPWSETYRGTSPGSEPCVQAMMNFINSHEFVTNNSIHTYSNLTLFPWGYTTGDTPDHDIFVAMSQAMTMYNGYQYGQPADLLYDVNGGTNDWVYGAQGEHAKCFSFTSEIGSGSDGFWPADSRRQQLFDENIWPAIYLMQVAGIWIDASGETVSGGNGDAYLNPGETANLSFILTNNSVLNGTTNVVVTASCDDPYLQLHTAQVSIGNMDAFSSVDLASTPFDVTLAAGCPDGRVVEVDFAVTSDDGDFNFTIGYPIGAPVAIFYDDFESGAGNWTTTGQWNTTNEASHSEVYSLTDTPGSDYADQTSYTATMVNEIAIPAGATLSFWHMYDIESGYDYGRVQISTGGGYSTLVSFDGSSAWTQHEIPLDSYAGQSIRLRFMMETDYSVTYDGWYIDDVLITGVSDENVLPAAPLLVSPAGGAVVGPIPELVVDNSIDPDSGFTPTYGFKIYDDALQTSVVASVSGITEGSTVTSWTPAALAVGQYWWRSFAADAEAFGLMGESRLFTVESGASGVGVVLGFGLNVIGPANGGGAELQLSLPEQGSIEIAIYNVRGETVKTLRSGDYTAGTHSITWNGRDNSGQSVSSGVYFARMVSGHRQATARIMMVK